MNNNELKKRVFSKSLACMILNLCILGGCAYDYYASRTFKIPPEIIPITENGSYFVKVPLDKPNKEPRDVKQWVADSLVKTFDYNFTNSKEHTAGLSYLFEPAAMKYIDTFINSGMLNTKVQSNSGVVKLIIAKPVDLQEGVLRGRYGWQAKTEGGLMLYSHNGTTRLGRYKITINMIREDESVVKSGIKIFSIQMKSY
ncbi:DotI/IcmL/TraM family protein [Photobacterium damselae]|uniref:DotI/IcmL/TraM family protein n=1 Tax=Photobacterium damselae TaxID=38293 RepID=UPI001F3A7659|nr:DotI/IcmL/TraM family protein [Photobacterium damselae]UKA04709.1 DotI/IcmL family type IV secretion protein [Photobacterium damselae subsp. damselae]